MKTVLVVVVAAVAAAGLVVAGHHVNAIRVRFYKLPALA